MSKSRAPLAIGLAVAGGAGYYLYNAGGNAKVAENKADSDLHKVSAEAKKYLPGSSPNAEKEFKGYGQEVGAKIDRAVSDADRAAGRAKSNVESYAKDAKAEALKAADKFDQKVTEGASQAKSGVSGWFGGGGNK